MNVVRLEPVLARAWAGQDPFEAARTQPGELAKSKDGRRTLHFLNPVPIQQVADRWIGKYARPFTRALVDLQADLEHRTA